jgi:hypothetical protein
VGKVAVSVSSVGNHASFGIRLGVHKTIALLGSICEQ